jgi:hypothetical protein
MRAIYKRKNGHYTVQISRKSKWIYRKTFPTLNEAIEARDRIERRYPSPFTMSPDEKFWAKVDKTSDPDGCWLWTGYCNPLGYGMYGKHELAYHYPWEQIHGQIPKGKVLDHICSKPICVNPCHLRAITQQQNTEHLKGAHRDNQSSGIRGVSWMKRRHLWQVEVCHNHHRYFGGHFINLLDAEQAAIGLRNKLMTFNDLDRQQSATYPNNQ